MGINKLWSPKNETRKGMPTHEETLERLATTFAVGAVRPLRTDEKRAPE